jgi:hypothetical protein
MYFRSWNGMCVYLIINEKYRKNSLVRYRRGKRKHEQKLGLKVWRGNKESPRFNDENDITTRK